MFVAYIKKGAYSIMGKRNARSKQIGQSQPLFFFSPVQESGAETVKMLTRQPYSFFQKKLCLPDFVTAQNMASRAL